jgi:hypothetical protein
MVGAVQRAVDDRPYEAVHPAAVDVELRVTLSVRPSLLQLLGGVIWTDARVCDRVGHAHGGPAVAHRETVRARERPEVVIEGAVLLDDEDEMLEVQLRQLELGELGTR